MSNKKRKTRNQKEKASQRRTQQSPSTSSTKQTKQPPAPSSTPRKTVDKPRTEIDSTPAQASSVAEKRLRHAERMRLMRISIQIFGVLVAVQVLLWLLDYTGVISLNIG